MSFLAQCRQNRALPRLQLLRSAPMHRKCSILLPQQAALRRLQLSSQRVMLFHRSCTQTYSQPREARRLPLPLHVVMRVLISSLTSTICRLFRQVLGYVHSGAQVSICGSTFRLATRCLGSKEAFDTLRASLLLKNLP